MTAAEAVDVLIPTYRRPDALAVTLAGVLGQAHRPLRVVVSDQTEDTDAWDAGPVAAVARVLRLRGVHVEWVKNLPRRGLAHQRAMLLERATAPAVLYLDDDVLLEPGVIARLLRVLRERRAGFAGAAMVGASYSDDVRPAERASFEVLHGPAVPERVVPGTPAWERYRLGNAANGHHLEIASGATHDQPVVYRVAWTAGCVLFDAQVLRRVGGFDFWRALPEVHAGEDVLAQLRVAELAGGVGVLPSGAWHQELPTTIPDRRVDAHRHLGWDRSA